MTTYNKLVRDLIPDIIAAKGEKATVRLATGEEYSLKLREKLQEEVDEFLASNDPQELADIMEVAYALARLIGHGPDQLEQIRATKAAERGSFDKGIILEEA